MATQTLTNFFISDTYKGLLHAQGATWPSSGVINMYDGNGISSSISLGKAGAGAGITGNVTITGTLVVEGATTVNDVMHVNGAFDCDALKAGVLNYPAVGSTNKAIVGITSTNQLGFFAQITSDMLAPPTPVGGNKIYTNVDNITVNSKGQIIDVTQNPADNDNTISHTSYRSGVLNDPVVFDFPETNNTYKEINISGRIGAGTKAIIGFLLWPSNITGLTGEDICVNFYAAPTNDDNQAVPILSIVGGEDADNDSARFGDFSQFHSRVSDNGRIWIKRHVVTSQENHMPDDNWRLFIVAYQY